MKDAKAEETRPAEPPIAAPPRRAVFDVARLAAAYAIVWLHTPRSPFLAETTVFARFAVPFFVFATVFFTFDSLARHPNRRFVEYAKGRFRRIYVPFLAWSAVYLAFKGAKSVLLPDQPNAYPGVEILWTGSFYHLWFMPFIFVVSLAAFLTARLVPRYPSAETAVGLFAGLAAVVVASLRLPMVPAEESREYAFLLLNAAPSVLGGVAFAVAYRRFGKGWETPAATMHGVLLFAAASAGLWFLGRDRMLETIAGFGFFLIALCPTGGASLSRAAALGSLAYGIYLAHLLFVKIAEALATKFDLAVAWYVDIAVFLFAAIGSTLAAALLARFRATRWMAA